MLPNENKLQSGYFGLAHRDTAIACEHRRLQDFIARFKHAILFTPKLLLADHMMFSPNFQLAYKNDDAFKYLLREDLIELAHFERYSNGAHFTLVELRKFYTWLNHGQNEQYHPLGSSCPIDPFDAELEAIQASVGRRFVTNSSQRDLLFTQFANEAIKGNEIKAVFEDKKLYLLYQMAFEKMKEDMASTSQPLGIIHFDEKHKIKGAKNIFDYMMDIPIMRQSSISRQGLVRKYREQIARTHRVLLIKAEMQLLENVHAVLPPELINYKTLVFSNSDGVAIDTIDREEIPEIPIDLYAIDVSTLASLTYENIRKLRESGEKYFEVIKSIEAGNNEPLEYVAQAVNEYCCVFR